MKGKYRTITLMVLISILVLSILAPVILAKQRKTYLTDFLFSNQIEHSGFSNSVNTDVFSYEATTGALEIIDHYFIYETPGDWGATNMNINITLFQESLGEKITPLLYSGGIILYNLYYLLRALTILNYSFSDAHINTIQTYIDECAQDGGGFSPTNTSTSASLISTYYSVKLYSMIGKLDFLDKSLHKNWVLNCRNTDGGYGGNSSLPSTIANTYYAILTVNILGTIEELVNPSTTVSYLNSFFISDISDERNFGGYLPDSQAKNALISSTYYSTKAISLLDNSKLHMENTTLWIKARQNFKDGGFADNSDGVDQKVSSISNSFLAFEILKIFDEDLLLLEEHVWMIEFNWFILLIILSSIGVVIVIGVIVWKKKKL